MYPETSQQTRQDPDELTNRFQAIIDADLKIESNDSMPAPYRETLIRQISQHAHSEIIGMQPEAEWIAKAPSLKRKTILLAKVQDEAGHGLYLYGVLETLGVQRASVLELLHTGRQKYSSIFNYPMLSWADVAVMGWLGDGAAIVNQIPLSRCSFGPYARAMARICQEESFHQRQGFDAMVVLVNGTAAQQEMAQDALDRWWWPTLALFGPPDSASTNTVNSMRWGIKRFTNDQLRQKFVNMAIPQIDFLGLTCPDKTIAWDEEQQRYSYADPDWDEFAAVVRGNGPCNAQRMDHRRRANADGAWVREAASAHAAKRECPTLCVVQVSLAGRRCPA
jgi:ring-1,2-phenylacetyl-CoA epoxidase subunit PaaA